MNEGFTTGAPYIGIYSQSLVGTRMRHGLPSRGIKSQRFLLSPSGGQASRRGPHIPILIIDAYKGTGKGEEFAEGGEDRGINHTQGRHEESDQNQHGSKRSHTDCHNQLNMPAHKVP